MRGAAVLCVAITCLAGSQAPAGRPTLLPAGSELDVLLGTAIDAGTVAADAPFEGVTLAAIVRVASMLDLAPAVVRGFVSSVRRSGKTRSAVTLSFEEVQLDAKPQRLRGSVVQVYQGRRPDTSEAAAQGVALNTERTALPGILILSGTVTATDGKNVLLLPGTVIRIRLDQAIEVRSR